MNFNTSRFIIYWNFSPTVCIVAPSMPPEMLQMQLRNEQLQRQRQQKLFQKAHNEQFQRQQEQIPVVFWAGLPRWERPTEGRQGEGRGPWGRKRGCKRRGEPTGEPMSRAEEWIEESLCMLCKLQLLLIAIIQHSFDNIQSHYNWIIAEINVLRNLLRPWTRKKRNKRMARQSPTWRFKVRSFDLYNLWWFETLK